VICKSLRKPLCASFVATFILFALGAYLLITGVYSRRVLDVDRVKRELSQQRKHAQDFMLPDKEARAFASSVEFLENYCDVLNEARDMPMSIGVFVLGASLFSGAGLIALWRRMSQVP
jgi:hypothetical protein